MSLPSDFVTSLILSQQYLYQYGGPILMAIGSLNCILNLIIFSKKNLRKNACSMYFIAFNIATFIFIYTIILSATLTYGYNITPSSYNLAICRLSMYINLVLDVLTPSYLILASIDRILFTSRNALVRRRSSQGLAYICIIGVTLFWILFHIHAFILINIVEFLPNYFLCYFVSDIYFISVVYYSLIAKAILVPLLMIVFGVWTLKNIRNIGRVQVNPVLSTTGRTTGNGSHTIHAKDRQLILTLLIDISIYIIFSSMLSGVLMYAQITQYNVKSIDQTQIELFFRDVGMFSSYIPFCIGCYTNLLVSKTFRKEVKNTLLCKFVV